MNLISSRNWFPKCMSCARFFIVSASMLCFSSLTRAEITSAEVQEIITILNHSLWNNDPTISPSIPTSLQEVTDFQDSLGAYLTGGTDIDSGFNYRNRDALPFHLQALIYGITGWNPQSNTGFDWSLHGDLQSLLAAVSNLSSSGASPSTNIFNVSVQPTNIINLTAPISPDVLAGNPWWASNSAFALTYSGYSYAYPDDGLSNNYSYSFPQAFSAFLSMINHRNNNSISATYSLNDEWGKDYVRSLGNGQARRPYNWFDWMSDATRSNWVASASYNRDLLLELRALSNALASVSASVNVTNQTYVFLTNLVSLSADDILAGNPWWATNSAFAHEWLSYPLVYPYPDASDQSLLSFPQAFSVLLSTLLPDPVGFYPSTPDSWGGEWQRYGIGGQNSDSPSPYRPRLSWFDWVSEAMKSNLVLQVSPSYSNLLQEYTLQDSDDPNPTNVPLPQYSLPSSETVSGVSETLSSAESGLLEKIESLQPHYTGGDDEIVVIPAFSVGGINVREYRARLSTSITPVCRSVASFIWYVGLFAFLFAFAKSEFVYYATLGKFWVHKG